MWLGSSRLAATDALDVRSAPPQCPNRHRRATSRAQIGAVTFRVSMTKRAASNASSRCGDEAATTTADSDTASGPSRWTIASRPTVGQRNRASPAIAAGASERLARRPRTPTAPRHRDPRRGRARCRRTPQPHRDQAAAQSYRAATGSASSVRANQSSPEAERARGCIVAGRPGRPCVATVLGRFRFCDAPHRCLPTSGRGATRPSFPLRPRA